MESPLYRLDRYFDLAPRASAAVEEIGPFHLFIGHPGYAYYARPRPGCTRTPSTGEIKRVIKRQRALNQPIAFEWIDGVAPSLERTLAEAGLTVHRFPLLSLSVLATPPVPLGYRIRLLSHLDPALPAARATVDLGFATPGTKRGEVGTLARDRLTDPTDPAHRPRREHIASGKLVMAIAEDSLGPVAGGSHAPRNSVTEIIGVATLPAHRRRGLGAAVTAELVKDALRRGVTTCILSAQDDTIARIYERIGFVRIGYSCAAE
ncbi:MAG: GNAT family N-acetyltransferase [Ferrimicrobium sp.]